MSILGIAYSGLSAIQKALEITGNNITNEHTVGYSRQSIQFAPSYSNRYAGSYIGTGVEVLAITRNADQFAIAQVRNSLSAKSQYDAFYQQAVQIDKLLSQNESSISGSLQSFFDSLSQLNSSPDNVASRNVVLKQAQLLVQRFNSMQSSLNDYQKNSSQQISEAVGKINQTNENIANVNKLLQSSPDSPDLLDQRDELIRELSQYTGLTVFQQSDGTVSVGTSSGNMLVNGTDYRSLSVSNNNSALFGTRILLNNPGGQIDITDNISSGMLGGLLDYEQGVIAQASQLIGKLAIGLSQSFNAQHQLGMDMNNQLGKLFFTDYNTISMQQNRSIPSASNSGTGVLNVSISDISQVQLSDYELIVSDAASNEFRLIRKSDGTSTTLNWTNTPPAPPAGQIVVDGMTISVDDTSHLADNDRFTLAPTRAAATDFALKINNVKELAIASPVKTSASLNNTGQGQIDLGTVLNTTAVQKQFRIDFISDTQYNLVNVTDSLSSGPFNIVPNSDNTIQIPDSVSPSYTVVLSGIPKSGDQFTMDFNSGGYGDNRNGLNLSGIATQKMFTGGSETIFDSYANLLADVGTQTNQAKTNAVSADALYNQALGFQKSKSGVDVNEEGMNLLKYRAAYQAVGKLMQVTNDIMNTLFDILR